MENFFYLAKDIFVALFCLCFILYLFKFVYFAFGFVPQKHFPKSEKKNKIAVLVAARDESAVIDDLLITLDRQTYDKSLYHTFIIVADEKDKTIDIASKYANTTCYVVDKNLKGKGRALDYGITQLKKEFGDVFDAYLIIDADNTANDNLIEKMNDAFSQGYDIVIGKKLNKSWKEGVVSNCSALTYTFIDTLNNKFRSKAGGNVTITGTGVLVSKKIINDKGGWKFHTITEDYELTLDSVVNNYKSYYYEHAVLTTEEPSSLKTTKVRRLRWIKGHNQVESMYRRKQFSQLFAWGDGNKFFQFEYLFSLTPIILSLVGILAFSIVCLVTAVYGFIKNIELALFALLCLAVVLGVLYVILVVYTLLALIVDKKSMDLTFKQKVAITLFNPFFLMMYVPIYARAVFVKEVEWVPIEHEVVLNTK